MLLGDIGPAEVKGDRLSSDDATQHQGRDGLAVVQVNAGPQPLIAAPESQAKEGIHHHSYSSLPVELLLGYNSSPCAISRRKFL